MSKHEIGGLMRKIPRKKEKSEKKKSFKVREWSGKESGFSRRRFGNWLTINLGISEGRARRITKELKKEFSRSNTVQPIDLILKASRLAVSLPYSRNDILGLPVFGGQIFAQVKPEDLGKAAGDIAGGIIDAGKAYWDGKWRPEDGGTKETLEFGGGLFFGDDGTAPHLDFSWEAPKECCVYRGVPGILLPIIISVTDDSGNLGNDSGVDTVEISGYGPQQNGRVGRTTLGKWNFDHWEKPDPNDPDEDSPAEVTEDGKVEFDDTICVPCQCILNGMALIQIIVKDKDDNKQIEYKSIPFSKADIKKCCS